MISSDIIRGTIDIMILYLLWQQDSYGYALSKQINEVSKEKYTIKETTLYSAFARLEKDGYITSYPGDETRGRKRTYYKITESGKAYYKEKCQEWKLTKKVVEEFIREDI